MDAAKLQKMKARPLEAPESIELPDELLEIEDLPELLLAYMRQPSVKRALVKRANEWVNLPIIPEGAEAILYGAVYDGILWGIQQISPT